MENEPTLWIFFLQKVLLDIEVLPLNQVMEYTVGNEEHVAFIQALVDTLSSNPDLFSCLSDHPAHSETLWNIDVDRSVEPYTSAVNHLMVPSVLQKSLTTVMIRNIPRKCTQRMLMGDIAGVGFSDKVDFVYLPTDISSAKNLGYAFINFKAAEFASDFRGRFNKKHLCSLRGSRAGLSVTFAVIQGLEANVENVIKNASVHRIRNPEYLPLVLSKELGKLVPCVSVMPQETERRNSHSSLHQPPKVWPNDSNMFSGGSRAMRAH